MKDKIDNLVKILWAPFIVSIILTIGIGGASVNFGNFSLAGIGLASVVGVILNLILPGKSKEVHVENE